MPAEVLGREPENHAQVSAEARATELWVHTRETAEKLAAMVCPRVYLPECYSRKSCLSSPSAAA